MDEKIFFSSPKKLICFAGLFFSVIVYSQKLPFEKDSLLGSNHRYRSWWDVKKYVVEVKPDLEKKSIRGTSKITFEIISVPSDKTIMLDLQHPMHIRSILWNGKKKLLFKTIENFHFVDVKNIPLKKGERHTLKIEFEGKPMEAKLPPWEGGWVWSIDKTGKPFFSVACQGIGASVWMPVKELQSDKADEGSELILHAPKGLIGVGNGQLVSQKSTTEGEIFHWKVTAPISTYNIIPYFGDYALVEDRFEGKKGKLNLSYFVLRGNEEKAKRHFQVREMLACFEEKLGSYPFYNDGYKLVEAPYLGMEHQSNIAYGNQYKKGYLGTDLSGTGLGLNFDFIVVHESGHEWFGNHITACDLADNWIHEGFTTYIEVIMLECLKGKAAGEKYIQGLFQRIENRAPLIPTYNKRLEPPTDIYFKGAALVHLIRQWMDDDKKFFEMLKEMNQRFGGRNCVTSKEIEKFIIEFSGLHLSSVFEVYLRQSIPPILELKSSNGKTAIRWKNVSKEFYLPIKINRQWVVPTDEFQTIPFENAEIDPNFYFLKEYIP